MSCDLITSIDALCCLLIASVQSFLTGSLCTICKTSAFQCAVYNFYTTFILDLSPKVINSDLSNCAEFIFAYTSDFAAAFQMNIMINILRNTQPKGTRKVIRGVSLLSVLTGFHNEFY